MRHNPKRAARWSGWWKQLSDEQRRQYAVDAHEPDIALTALARALELDGDGDRADVARLLGEVRERSDDPRPQESLARLLERLPA